MTCLPMARVEVENFASALPLRLNVAKLVVPSTKVTFPVAVPEPEEVTVAVKVTEVPSIAVGLLEETAVVVAAGREAL